jgi:outer membrane receptor protein involved in Fe transport
MTGARLLLVTIAIATAVSSARAGSQGVIVGRISDARDGRALAGAIVESLATGATALTGEDGAFRLEGLPGGQTRLRVRLDGYVVVEVVVLVDVNADASTLTVELVPSQLRLDETIVVTASRDERPAASAPRATSVVPAEEILRTTPRTTPEALTRAPGVWVQKTNHGGGSPFVRGLVGNQVLVMIDGLRLNNSTFRYGPNQYLATVDPSMATQIEVLRGSGSVQYGSDALGGVIQIRNREPRFSPEGSRTRGGVSGRLMTEGMEQSLQVALDHASPGVAATASLAVRDFGDLVAGGDLGKESPSGYQEVSGDARARWRLGATRDLQLVYQHVHQDDVPRWDQVAQRGYARYAFDPQVRQLAYARLAQQTSGPWPGLLTLTGAWQRSREGRERQRQGSTILTVEEDLIDTWAATGEWRVAPGRGWTLTAGGEIYRDQVGSWREDRDLACGCAEPRRGQFPDGATAFNAAAFGLAHLDTSRLTIDAGTRYTWTRLSADDATFGDVALSPGALVSSAAALVPIASGFSGYAGVSQGFRAPNLDDVSTLGPFDFGVEIPASHLVPERSLSVEAGLRVRLTGAAVSAAVFRTNLENLIDRVRVAPPPGLDIGDDRVYQRANVGEAYIRGVEADGEWALAPRTVVFGHVAYAFGQNTTLDEPVRRIPPLNGLIGLRHDGARGWWMQATLQLAGLQDRLASGDRDDHRIAPGGTPGWQVLDVYAGLAMGRRVSWSLGLLNLFDEAYRAHGSGIDGYGRSARLGIEVRF